MSAIEPPRRARYGVVGVGRRGRALVRAACATGEVDCVAFADPHEPSRREAQELLPTARAYASWRDLLAREELDALLVATPNDEHAEVVIEALRVGLNVLCEKPLATTLEDYDRIADAASRSSAVLQVGMELRFSPLFRDMKADIDRGAIGAPKLLWAHEFRPPFLPGVGEWRGSVARTGGALLEKSCHHLDLFAWFANARPRRVLAVGTDDTVYPGTGLLDRAWVTVEHDNGVQASHGLSLFHHREILRVGVLGTEGAIEAVIDPEQEDVFVDARAGREQRKYETRRGGFAHGGEVEQQRAFVRAVREKGASPLDTATARWSHVACLASELAVREARPVRIDESGAFGVEAN